MTKEDSQEVVDVQPTETSNMDQIKKEMAELLEEQAKMKLDYQNSIKKLQESIPKQVGVGSYNTEQKQPRILDCSGQESGVIAAQLSQYIRENQHKIKMGI